MPQELDVRQAVARYLANELALAELHARVAAAFARSHDDVAMNHVYGLLTDLHADLLSEQELRDELQALVSEVRVLPAWSLMADWVNDSRSASTSVVIPPPAVPLPQSSPMFFERSPAGEPA
jgi:hypothetical protein